VDFEKLGAFYLGKRIDADIGTQTDELVLYDAKDLTTHAVIIGMTGSGKTGLGIGLLEEAAIDKVPVIAIDPKGDMGNMLLAFPDLTAADFAPWVNERQALDQATVTRGSSAAASARSVVVS
jgi:DNA helicase HerA-like ATPase